MDWVALLINKVLPIVSAVIAIAAAIDARLSARRSALFAQRSAAAGERSAAISEAALRSEIWPHVVAEVVPRAPMTRMGAGRREIVLVNRGNGVARDVSARLQMTCEGRDSPLDTECSALPKDSEHVVARAPTSGPVGVWGEIAFKDTEGGAYLVSKRRDDQTWRAASEPTATRTTPGPNG